MNSWRRARKNERCGFCLDHVFTGGEPLFLYGGFMKRCAAVAKSRYGQDVPVPFPEDEATVAPSVARKPDFVTVGALAGRFDVKQRQAGED